MSDAPNPVLLVAADPPEGPANYAVELTTTKGPIVIDVDRALAPRAADRFHQLVRLGFFEQVAFFRAIAGFVVQAGLHGNPAVNKAWRNARLKDDPVRTSNAAGTLSFASAGPNTRTTQFFINLGDNRRLDPMGFAPFARVRDLEIVRRLHTGYGEGPPGGRGPQPGAVHRQGNAYLKAEFPELDYILRAGLA
jgi:peptidyl-prolyl cis-trans isomerase A (cyclophilin A)